MRCELDLVRAEMELFEQLAGVAMAEDRIRGEVIGSGHEVGLRCGGLSCSADSGFCIADDPMIEVDYASLQQGCEREDDRGRVAAGVGHEPGSPDGVAVQLRATVDCLRLQLCS